MRLPRIHAFEFNDQSWLPESIRESIIETLGHTLRWTRHYDAAVPQIRKMMIAGGTDTVVDLCSGSGEPAAGLLAALERSDQLPAHFLLTDLYPNEGAMRKVAERFDPVVQPILHPVDATDLPSDWRGSLRLIISAFHHFPPPLATAILADSQSSRSPIMILEPFPRQIIPWLLTWPGLTLTHFASPFLASRTPVLRAWLNWLTPFVLICGGWDGFVSLLRQYEQDEYFSLVRSEQGYRWEYQLLDAGLGRKIPIFTGIPEVGQ